ncbi:Myb family transcription factor APL [Acorus calamus]|uniref:Myb family transcription factor APL n=1 Tax=Acorus calamus TaxID=4465 RepID=A0AAV9F167_ACOCL|nr:Myb family transcription factor APL [Acorus calamus]
MYHHHSKNSLLSSRASFSPERHLFMQRSDASTDAGLVLSTDAKPRLKWTPELHERFIEAVNQLGGANKATPKTVMRLMGIPGLTLYHLKSHLQKYRLSKNLHSQPNIGITKISERGCTAAEDRMCDISGVLISNSELGTHTNRNLQISEALQMQIEVQRRLHEQLEVQRHLQLRIEAQGKYLQSVLEKAQETIGKPNVGSAGLDAARVQLSELASKVSNDCNTLGFSELKEASGFYTQKTQANHLADCSVESCLTSCEVSQKEQDTHNALMGLKPHPEDAMMNHNQEERHERRQRAYDEELNGSNIFSSRRELENMLTSEQRDLDDLSMSIGVQGEKGRGSYHHTLTEQWPPRKQDQGKHLRGCKATYSVAQLDLNVQDEGDAASHGKQFDLNGFSWN